MSNKSTASLIVRLEGESEIDINTLINMLTHYMTIAHRANDIVGQGEYKAEIKVKAMNQGSFEISLEMVTTWLQEIFSNRNVQYASAVVGCIAGAIELYKHFKGRKITEEEAKSVNINLHQTNIQNIYHVYSDESTNLAVRKSFETANADPSVSGITIVANGVEGSTISDEEFPELMNSPKEDATPPTRTLVDTARLVITSLSFEKGQVWRFIYQGNKISTKLSDDGLQEAIEAGTSFAKGDALEVELETTQLWSSDYKAYLNKSYKIVRVLQHIRAEQQPELFS